MQRCALLLCALAPIALVQPALAQSPDASDWGHVGGDPGGQYYSHLTQITRDNVAQLQRAWVYRAREPLAGASAPVLGFGLLYFVTPNGVLTALDPATGVERWRFGRPHLASAPGQRLRTVVLWQQDESVAPAAGIVPSCNRRAFLPMQQRLMVLDATTGKPCEGLSDGISVEAEIGSLVLHRGLVIALLGSGSLRAFDAITGAPRWRLALDSLATGADGLDTQGQLSLDAALGLVFVPGASQLAVETSTGKPAWLLRANPGETTRPAAQAALVAINTPAGPLPVLVQPTPAGELRLLHRDRGTSIGHTSLLLLQRGHYAREDAWGLTFLDRGLCARRITRLEREPSVNPSNVAIDMDRNRMIVALNDLPVRLGPLLAGTLKAKDEPLLSIFGLPCVRPPWGSLMSVDLQRHAIVWQIPLGSSSNVLPAFLPTRDFGAPNSGGPMVTAGGLVFIAATPDRLLRAFDVDTGKNLWQTPLPAPAHGTPISYRAGTDQRQYVVIAGGDSDQVLAFALPRSEPGR